MLKRLHLIMKGIIIIAAVYLLPALLNAQLMREKTTFTNADTLRGSITSFRKGWDVLKYDLTVEPDIITKTITGKNIITYYETLAVHTMQIDLQQPLVVDSIKGENNNKLHIQARWKYLFVHLRDSLAKYKISPGVRKLTVYYHGKPRVKPFARHGMEV